METDISGLFYCSRQQRAHGNNKVLKGEPVQLGEGSCQSPPLTASTRRARKARRAAPLCGSRPAHGPEGSEAHGTDAPAIDSSLQNACGSSGEPVGAGRQPHPLLAGAPGGCGAWL